MTTDLPLFLTVPLVSSTGLDSVGHLVLVASAPNEPSSAAPTELVFVALPEPVSVAPNEPASAALTETVRLANVVFVGTTYNADLVLKAGSGF